MREFNYPIMPEIMRRWSPRAFSEAPVAKEEILALLEAARFAPSCYNEQPWRFIVAHTPEELQAMQSLLAEQNHAWAKHAPALLLLLAKRTFSHQGQENYWHVFDTGTAWGFLSLEAERRGMIAHAMGGFSRKRAAQLFGLSPDFAPIAIVAIGKLGDPSSLSPELQEREQPGMRRALSELIISSPDRKS